jgi:plasmid maintenance system antidote protein VapI
VISLEYMNKGKSENWLRAELLKAFERSGLNRLAWSKQADVDYSAVHGFVEGSRDVTLATASRLANVLGLELRARKGG